jgi:hypothetical protein
VTIRDLVGEGVCEVVCDVTFELAKHEFHRTFYVLRDLRVANLIMGLPWLDDEHASLQFGTTRVFTLMDGTTVETLLEERRHECLLMSSTKVQKRMRKTRRSKGREAEFYVIELTLVADQPTEFHTGEELTAYQRDNFRSLLYDDFRSYCNLWTLHMQADIGIIPLTQMAR